jgi:ABC-2 type transport system permease protein
MSDLAFSVPSAFTVTTTDLRPASGFKQARIMSARSLRWTLRNVEGLVPSLSMPVALMLIFTYLFGGAIRTGTPHYVTYVVPGILLLCASYGSSFTALAVCQDMTGGIVDRFQTMDVHGTALLTGHVVASVVRNTVSTILAFLVAFAIGFRPSAGLLDWLGVIGVMLLFVLAVTWLCAAIGILTKSPESASSVGFILLFVPYASSAFVPINTMPSWLRGFAYHQPVTPVIESLRGLLLSEPVASHIWAALAWCCGILVVSMSISGVAFRIRTAK